MDEVLVDALRIALRPDQCHEAKDPPIVYAASLAEEIEAEGGRLLLSADTVDRALMARLVEAPVNSYPQPPVPYLLGCYARISARLLGLGAAPDRDALTRVLLATKEQVVNYTWLAASAAGVVAQPAALEQRGHRQLFDALWAAATDTRVPVHDGASAACEPLPAGLLTDIVRAFPDDAVDALSPMLHELCLRANSTSILGDYFALLNAWKLLCESREAAVAVSQTPSFAGEATAAGTSGGAARNGRVFQMSSALAALLSVSYLPDDGLLAEPQPSVRRQCFDPLDIKQQPAAVASTLHSLQQATKALVQAVGAMLGPKVLLAKECRPQTLRWMATALACNSERAKMKVDPFKASSDGFAYNFCRVMLGLAGPFLDIQNGKVAHFVDVRYTDGSGALAYEGEARLAADMAQVDAWRAARADGDAPVHHFVCECFFLAAHSIHLGPIKIAESMQHDARTFRHLQSMLAHMPTDQRLVMEYQRYKAKMLAAEGALADPEFVRDAVRWCKLVAAWLLFLATSVTTVGHVALPLRDVVPDAFRMVPEYIVSDMCDLLKYMSTMRADAFAAESLDEVVLCCTAFMSSPAYVTNPYTRYRLAEVLFYWMPDRAALARRARADARTLNMEYLFTVHNGVVSQLVPGLLQLYQDIEYTERGNQFYEKFQMRGEIADLLAWLWEVPQHRENWRRVGAENGGRGGYMRFLNYLINDCIYLLDEAIKKLPDLKEAQAKLDDPSWHTLGARQQQDHRADLEQIGSIVRFNLQTADSFINMLVFTSSDVAAPLLLPEMVERVAAMLNYFLKYLTGSERGKLKVRDPEKYNFNPKRLLSRILNIYLNIWGADREGAFVAAVVEDGRSYRPENFTEAIRVATGVGLPDFGMNHVARLEQLAERAAECAEQQRLDDEEFVDVPDDFLDPITCSIMKDPVILPTSRTTMDRASILRHLLSDPRDPINRAPLNAEDLIVDTEMKGRIDAWIAEQRHKRR